MKKTGKRRAWWWVALAVVLVCIGILLYWQMSRHKTQGEEASIITPKPPVETGPPPVQTPTTTQETKVVAPIQAEQPPPEKPSLKDYDVSRAGEDMAGFFRSLNHRAYIRRLDPAIDCSSRFRAILKRLAARPPMPAGEGIDPAIIVRNIYHLYRILDHKDLRLIQEVVRNEKDSLELNLYIFYSWLTASGVTPNPVGMGVSKETIYQYAGFFLNTIGGRAYLFRRSSRLRLLMTYYSLLVVHDADKRGKNIYGIDIFPYISPLEKEISHYSELQFQTDYLEALSQLQDYYLKKR